MCSDYRHVMIQPSECYGGLLQTEIKFKDVREICDWNQKCVVFVKRNKKQGKLIQLKEFIDTNSDLFNSEKRCGPAFKSKGRNNYK